MEKYIKKYHTKTDFAIYFQNENETKFVREGLNSPKVQKWLAEGNEFEVINFVEPDLVELKAEKLAQFKEMANAELQKTDYIVIRQFERKEAKKASKLLDEAAFIAFSNERQIIRDKANQLETDLANATTYEEIQAVVW